jgi:hypothetical protein
MKRQVSNLAADRGQTLVWVAVGMVVLMGILALAVDVGHLYAERRHMQNAADAGALEAARARCFDNDTAAAAATKGTNFMTTYNSRPDAVSRDYLVVPDPSNDWQFIATASEETPTYFARALGISQSGVGATAKAACGPSDRGCGLFPLAFQEDLWNQVKDRCGETLYIWTSAEDTGNGQGCPKLPDCTLCDCTQLYDNSNKLISNAIMVPDAGRAWLDFTSVSEGLYQDPACSDKNGCSASEIACWIRADSPALLMNDSCVASTNGVKAGVRNAVNDRAKTPEAYASVPLYDTTCSPLPPEGSTNDCGSGYNIVGFGCTKVVTWPNQPVKMLYLATPTPDPNATPGPTPTPDPNADCGNNNFCWKGQLLPIEVACDKCDTTCARTGAGGPPGSGIKGVSLIK